MEKIRMVRIAYFIGMSQVAAILAGHELSIEDAEDILASIRVSAIKMGCDSYQIYDTTVEEIKQVMGLINPEWR